MKAIVKHQGRGGFIEVGNYKFEIEMMVGKPDFCIYFPSKQLDKSLSYARIEIEKLIVAEPGKWELEEYDSNHGFYDAMTVNERLFVSGLMDDFDTARQSKDDKLMVRILQEVELSEENIEAIVKDA